MESPGRLAFFIGQRRTYAHSCNDVEMSMMEVTQEQWRRWGRPGTRKRVVAKEARGDAVAGEGREGAIIQRGIHLLVSSVLRLLASPIHRRWASHMDVHPQHVRITETSQKVFLWTSVPPY